MDITGGLPRVTEIFEARKPKDPAVLAEISGTDRDPLRQAPRQDDHHRPQRDAAWRSEHHVPQDKELQVHAGDYVEAGDPLIRGPLIPHDILRIKGEEALYQYLLTEVQNVYRSQGVKINDKHIEIILNQMLRKVKVEDPGDTKFLPGEVRRQVPVPRRQRAVAAERARSPSPAAPNFKEGEVVTKAEFKEANEGRRSRRQGAGQGQEAQVRPVARRCCWASPRRRCRASRSSRAASFQETTKVLTEAALAGAVDTLVGLKENVILGHLIPAGTAFNPHLNLQDQAPGRAAGAAGAGDHASGADGHDDHVGLAFGTRFGRCGSASRELILA